MASKIYTRTGDFGETALVGGTRISKASLRVDAYGAMDETNTVVGAAFARCEDMQLCRILEFVMHKLFNCSSLLAHPVAIASKVRITSKDIEFLEDSIDSLQSATDPIRGFALPTGCDLAACLHMARTTCRRAERRLVTLHRKEPVDECLLRFVNRLSDLLFAAARYANHIASQPDILWDSGR